MKDYNPSTIWTEKPASSIQQFKLNTTFRNSGMSHPQTPQSKLHQSQSLGSGSHLQPEPTSLDNLNVYENKVSSHSRLSSVNDQSFQMEKLTNRELFKDSFKENLKSSMEPEKEKENILRTSKEFSHHLNTYQYPTRELSHPIVAQQKQSQVSNRGEQNLADQILNNYNNHNNNHTPYSKSFSSPNTETDFGGNDYKKEYEKLLGKVEEQEKQLVNL